MVGIASKLTHTRQTIRCERYVYAPYLKHVLYPFLRAKPKTVNEQDRGPTKMQPL